MIGRCVGGHWPPLRLGNVQMDYKRCAEVAPQGTFSCPDGQFTLPHPTVKFVDRCNSQELSVVTRKRVARHGYPTGGSSLAFRAIHLVSRLRR